MPAMPPPTGPTPALERVRARIREVFEAPEAAVYLVATGTAANALSLACLCPPWATVYCHRERACRRGRVRGAGVLYRRGEADAHRRRARAHRPRGPGAGDRRDRAQGVHNVQKGALSLSNATEAGTVYDPEAVAELAGVARAAGLPVHMDGARFANAVAALGCSPAELTWKAGVDVAQLRRHQERLPRGGGGGAVRSRRAPGSSSSAASAAGISSPSTASSRRRWRRISRATSGSTWPRRRTRGRGSSRRGSRRCRARRWCIRREANAVFASWPRARHWAAQAAGAHYYLWPARPEPGRAGGGAAVGAARLQLGDDAGGGGAASRLARGELPVV